MSTNYVANGRSLVFTEKVEKKSTFPMVGKFSSSTFEHKTLPKKLLRIDFMSKIRWEHQNWTNENELERVWKSIEFLMAIKTIYYVTKAYKRC